MKAKVTVTLKKRWSDAEFKPNDEQKEAIVYTGGPLYIPAGRDPVKLAFCFAKRKS
jgi:hypothetical protein